MSSLNDPIGPHSRKVYMRRRIVLLAILIAIPVIVLLIIFKPGSSSGTSEQKTVELPDDMKSTSKATTAADEDLPGCKKSNMAVTAAASSASYGPGENPQIWMTISNTSTKPCVVDLGTKELSFEIKSGSETYWVSTHCQTDADSREVILEPGKPLSTEPLTWDRTRSSPETCGADRPAVPAGGAAYNVTATANGVKSAESWQFLLY